VLNQRAKLEDEQQHAARAELAAQLNVEKAHATLVSAGGSAHVGLLGSSSRSPDHASRANHGNGKNASPGTTPSATSSDASPTTATGVPLDHALSPAEMKTQAAERAFNQAKLDLAAAEDYFEQKRGASEQMNASLRSESRRLEVLERAQLMVRALLCVRLVPAVERSTLCVQKCAKEFVVARMEAARSSMKAWEALKVELEHTVRRRGIYRQYVRSFS
jgi:outer membrane protein TolC